MPTKLLRKKDRWNKGKEVYWYGLAPDGSKAYDYNNFFDFSNAPVFDGESLKEVWERVELFCVDRVDPKMRIKEFYLKL